MAYTVGESLKRIVQKIKVNLDFELKDEDLTASQTVVLLLLLDNKERKISQKFIWEQLGLKHSTVIGILKRLETKGFVQCLIDEENHKYRNVVATEKAQVLDRILLEKQAKVDAMILKGFTEEETELLTSFLERIDKNLEESQ